MALKCFSFLGMCGMVFPQRFIIIIFCILGVLIARLQKNQTNLLTTIEEAYRKRSLNSSRTVQNFEWRQDNRDLAFITTGHPIGHFLGQIPAGILADRYSGKWTYFTGIFAGSILTLLSPIVLVNQAPWFLIAFIRILLGLCHSAVFPCVASIVSHWIPYSERGMLGAYCFASYPLFYVIGEFIGFSYTSFYFSGGVGLIWCSLCVIILFDNAEKHPRISVEEKQLLQEKMPDDVKVKFQCKNFCKDKGVWALILGQVGHNLTIAMMIRIVNTEIINTTPILRRCIVTCGFIGMWITSTLTGYFADYSLAKKNWDLKLTRRLMTLVSFAASNTFLCIVAYLTRHVISTVFIFALAVFSKGIHYPGHRINHMDLTVNFNGILMAILNVSSDIFGSIIGGGYQMVAGGEDLEAFQKHVWYAFSVNVIFVTCYFILARVERAKWDIPPQEVV